MSRDYYNPLLVVIVAVLLGLRMRAAGDAVTLEYWLLTLCFTGVVVDGTLALCRSLTQRPAMRSLVWAFVFLMIGCSAWVYVTNDSDLDRESLAAYRQMRAAYKDGADVNAVNEEGYTLLVLAVKCGKEDMVRELLARGDVVEQVQQEAAACAVEQGRVAELELLLQAGVSADAAPYGVPLLSLAALRAKEQVAKLLLEKGANPVMTDNRGDTPLHYAAMSNSPGIIRLLRAAGADPAQKNADGRIPIMDARSAKAAEALK